MLYHIIIYPYYNLRVCPESPKRQEYEGGGAEDLALCMEVPPASDDSASEDEAGRGLNNNSYNSNHSYNTDNDRSSPPTHNSNNYSNNGNNRFKEYSSSEKAVLFP